MADQGRSPGRSSRRASFAADPVRRPPNLFCGGARGRNSSLTLAHPLQVRNQSPPPFVAAPPRSMLASTPKLGSPGPPTSPGAGSSRGAGPSSSAAELPDSMAARVARRAERTGAHLPGQDPFRPAPVQTSAVLKGFLADPSPGRAPATASPGRPLAATAPRPVSPARAPAAAPEKPVSPARAPAAPPAAAASSSSKAPAERKASVSPAKRTPSPGRASSPGRTTTPPSSRAARPPNRPPARPTARPTDGPPITRAGPPR